MIVDEDSQNDVQEQLRKLVDYALAHLFNG